MSAPAFPTVHVADIAAPVDTEPWLVRSLWPAAAVGLLAGPPKVTKTWLALDIAVSVSSATPCLGRFEVATPGPALLYLAEDSLASVRARIEGICRHRRLELAKAQIHFITTPSLRLDREEDKQRLFATVSLVRPRLLVLDPLVRIHGCDENDAGAISSLLASLRQLQRTHDVAILLVHHTRKNGRGPQGYALRGSGDLYAWGDAYAYLSRRDRTLRLALEHRSHPPSDPVALRLVSEADGSCTHLELAATDSTTTQPPLEDLVLAELSALQAPLRRTALRSRLKVNNQRLGLALRKLLAEGRVRTDSQGWTAVH
jgi:hypothetical protein